MTTESDAERALRILAERAAAIDPSLTLGLLLGACDRIDGYPPEKIHALARRSALWAVDVKPGCTVDDVRKLVGLGPENAARAVRQLCEMGQIRLRATGGYEVTGGPS